MGDDLTEREKALAARVAELEAAAKEREAASAGASIVEQVWRYFSAFLPPSIIAVGVGIFLLFQLLVYYNSAQMLAGETRLKNAKAALAEAKATAANWKDNGSPLRIETVRAEVEKKQQEAARAKIEADAQTAIIENQTAALQKVRADVAKKQAEAENAQQEAEAATARFGAQTLVEREMFVKFLEAELNNMFARYNIAAQQANMTDSSLLAGYPQRVYPSVIDAECKENALAEYLGCPKQYVAALENNRKRLQSPRRRRPLRLPKKRPCERQQGWIAAKQRSASIM